MCHSVPSNEAERAACAPIDGPVHSPVEVSAPSPIAASARSLTEVSAPSASGTWRKIDITRSIHRSSKLENQSHVQPVNSFSSRLSYGALLASRAAVPGLEDERRSPASHTGIEDRRVQFLNFSAAVINTAVMRRVTRFKKSNLYKI